jgi:SAM-dependent methyltransferase
MTSIIIRKFLRLCRCLLLRGYKFKCPLCDNTLRRFLPGGAHYPVLKEKKVIGSGYRLNFKCPCCQALDRERLIYLYLLYKTDIFNKPIKLLHVAPEKSLRKKLQECKNFDYLTADLHSSSVMVKMDIANIQYPDTSFDVIICNHVLEHIIDDHKAMSELYRILKWGGWAILQVPISLQLHQTYEDMTITKPRERMVAFGQNDHVRIYARDYRDRLERVGFKVEEFDWNSDERFGGVKNQFGLNEEERVYLASKPPTAK